MTDQPAETAVIPQAGGQEDSAQNDPGQGDTVRDAFSRLYTDARAYVGAEADKQKARASVIGGGVRDAAIYVSVALMLLFATLVAFLIGLIIGLTPRLGPLGATFTVLGASMVVTLGLLLLAKARITRMKKAIAP